MGLLGLLSAQDFTSFDQSVFPGYTCVRVHVIVDKIQSRMYACVCSRTNNDRSSSRHRHKNVDDHNFRHVGNDTR